MPLCSTTNHLERLDPALSRPGRMDVWVEFKNASKWQAELLFRNFFPSTDEDDVVIEGELEGIELPTPPSPSAQSPSGFSSLFSSGSMPSTPVTLTSMSTPPTPEGKATGKAKASFIDNSLRNQAYLPPPVDDEIAQHSAKPLDGQTLARLAKMFADAIPEEEFSVAALQGYLLKNKSRPEAAAEEAAGWVVSEREMRERLRKEREARELKEKLEREKRRKDLLLKEKKEAELKKKEEEEVQRRLIEEKIRAEQRARLEAEKLLAEAVAEADKENDSPAEDGGADGNDEQTLEEPSSPVDEPVSMEGTQLWVNVDSNGTHAHGSD